MPRRRIGSCSCACRCGREAGWDALLAQERCSCACGPAAFSCSRSLQWPSGPAEAHPSSRCHPTAAQAMGRLKELAQSGIHFCVGLDLEPYGAGLGGWAVCCAASAGGWVCTLHTQRLLMLPHRSCCFALKQCFCRLVCERAVHAAGRPGSQHRGAGHVVGAGVWVGVAAAAACGRERQPRAPLCPLGGVWLSNSTRCCVLHKGVGEPCTHSLLHRCRRDEAGQVQRVTVDGMERDMKVKFLRVRGSSALLGIVAACLPAAAAGTAQAVGWCVVACRPWMLVLHVPHAHPSCRCVRPSSRPCPTASRPSGCAWGRWTASCTLECPSSSSETCRVGGRRGLVGMAELGMFGCD